MNNTSCIFTVIKDEQEYIEEFITYHLNLGVDHIFIFEDTDSTSHKDICDKYSDRVTLNSIEMFSFDFYKRFAINNGWNEMRQRAYNQEGLDWIKNNFNYDWCFAIDCDEYITLEDESKTLPEVLNMYSDYGAVILSWQNYNANGHIKKPDYKEGGLVKTYTQKCGKSPTDPIWKTTKIVFKFDKFKKQYFLGTHLCSDLCNWVKSDFSKELKTPIFNNIYLRHYITKSWEEFYWKLKIRGMFHKNHRKLEEFFIMNPDMIDRKYELLNMFNKNRINRHRFGVEYHLVDSCNLNCAGCSHYSSLINEKTIVPLDTIIKDMTLLRDKVGDNLKWLRLLGGEPLLHPNIEECLVKIREIFPNIMISIVTNGILLKSMKQEFFDTCLNCNIEIHITDYGVVKNLSSMIVGLNKSGIKSRFYRKSTIWHYQHIRLNDERIDCLSKCGYKNICNNYRNGKIYLCPHIAYVEYFNKYFNKNIQLDKTDYIDLNDIKSFDELIERLNNLESNFCYQYCNYYDKDHPINGKWKQTKKDINEFCLT